MSVFTPYEGWQDGDILQVMIPTDDGVIWHDVSIVGCASDAIGCQCIVEKGEGGGLPKSVYQIVSADKEIIKLTYEQAKKKTEEEAKARLVRWKAEDANFAAWVERGGQ